MDEVIGARGRPTTVVWRQPCLCGGERWVDTNVSGYYWPSQGKARTVTNKQPTTEQQLSTCINIMREKSAARRVFVHLLGELNWSCQISRCVLTVVMMRIIARRNSEATLHSPFGVAAALAEMGVLLTPILAPQDATLETRPHSHGNLLVPRYPPT